MRTCTQRRFFVVTRVKVRAGVSHWEAAGAFLFTYSRWFSRKGGPAFFTTDAAGFPTPMSIVDQRLINDGSVEELRRRSFTVFVRSVFPQAGCGIWPPSFP